MLPIYAKFHLSCGMCVGQFSCFFVSCCLSILKTPICCSPLVYIIYCHRVIRGDSYSYCVPHPPAEEVLRRRGKTRPSHCMSLKSDSRIVGERHANFKKFRSQWGLHGPWSYWTRHCGSFIKAKAIHGIMNGEFDPQSSRGPTYTLPDSSFLRLNSLFSRSSLLGIQIIPGTSITLRWVALNCRWIFFDQSHKKKKIMKYVERRFRWTEEDRQIIFNYWSGLCIKVIPLFARSSAIIHSLFGAAAIWWFIGSPEWAETSSLNK